MTETLRLIKEARRLAKAGRHAAVVELLGDTSIEAIKASPSLSLLYGTSHARIGRQIEGSQWVDNAIELSRKQGDREVEAWALNARGAIAFVSGSIDEAADYFTQCLMAASRDEDHATIGRCSNNLGIIANLRGRQAEAIGSYKLALAAYQRADLPTGAAESRHNLGISLQEQGNLKQALVEAERAVEEAATTGDSALSAMTIRGCAEIRVALGDLEAARLEIEGALAVHRSLEDAAEEVQDLRIIASILAAEEDHAKAEVTLHDVIQRAESQDRPQLVAEATRDLAYVLKAMGREAEAFSATRSAITIFTMLGAEAEVRALDSHEWDCPLTNDLKKALEPLHEAQLLADQGRFPELLDYLGKCDLETIERSPTLALLQGIGHARLGRLDEGLQWVVISLSRARALGDRPVEVRGLNVYGAIALERGGIDEATEFFSKAQTEAMRVGELTTVGRASNNLGIIANMQGDFGRAISCYTFAAASYGRAGFDRGVAETHHNLAITYRDQGDCAEALKAADRAVEEARRLGDMGMKAQAIAGRAEVRVVSGDAKLARREAQKALEIHRDLSEDVREAEDMRILACALAGCGEEDEAETMLKEVIERAAVHDRPLLAATARRDLAFLLKRAGSEPDAQVLADAAKEQFQQLGATVQVRKIDAFMDTETKSDAEAIATGTSHA